MIIKSAVNVDIDFSGILLPRILGAGDENERSAVKRKIISKAIIKAEILFMVLPLKKGAKNDF